MEAEVNSHVTESLSRVNDVMMLSHQLQHLLVCLDVFLETSQHPTTTSEHEQCRLDRICSRLARSLSVSVLY